VAEVSPRGDRGFLLAGTATRGDWDSRDDDYCDGEGPATRDLAVLELSAGGRLDGTHTLSESDLGGCAVAVEGATPDEGRLIVDATVRESPGLLGGEGGPESREREYATRLDPDEDEFDDVEPEDRLGYAEVRLPEGDSVAIAEDPGRERQTAEGLYLPTISLIRSMAGGARVWAHPITAISEDADLEDIVFEGGGGWALFRDGRGRYYGVAHYSLLSSGYVEVVAFRHRRDGRPDSSFGRRGRILVEAQWLHGTARAVQLRDGDVAIGGAVGQDEPGKVVVRRLSAAGEPRRAFDRAAAGPVDCRPPVALAARGDGVMVACSRGDGAFVAFALRGDGLLDRGFGRGGKVVVNRV
jgi:hypothetical protein